MSNCNVCSGRKTVELCTWTDEPWPEIACTKCRGTGINVEPIDWNVIESPAEIKWHSTPIPPVESVRYLTRLLGWTVTRNGRFYISIVVPYADENNGLKWCSASGMPVNPKDIRWWAKLAEPVYPE